MTAEDLPYLDLAAPGFSTRSEEVIRARAKSWCARTSAGLAVLRHRQAGQLLRDRRLRRGSHAWPDTIGINGAFAEFWRRSVISQEGAPHKALRQIAQAALDPDFIRSMAPEFTEMAEDLVANLKTVPNFEFVDAFTEPFAGRAIAHLIGLSQDCAVLLAQNASALGLAMGPEAKQYQTVTNTACEALMTQADALIDARTDTGFVARLLAAAEKAGLSDRQALVDLVVISIFGGVDTTRAQLAFAIHLFIHHMDQWIWLRGNLQAVPQAVEEVIRARPTTTWATREALEDFEFEGVHIRAGDTLYIFVHASATDPELGGVQGFDIRVPRKIHFGFGGGAHHCLGQLVARTDMAAALEVLLRHWVSVELVGTPEFLPDSGNTSPSSLRVAPVWA